MAGYKDRRIVSKSLSALAARGIPTASLSVLRASWKCFWRHEGGKRLRAVRETVSVGKVSQRLRGSSPKQRGEQQQRLQKHLQPTDWSICSAAGHSWAR